MKNEEYLKFAKHIAFYAGFVMNKYFTVDNGAKYKKDKTIVTLADEQINSYLIKNVKEIFPTHAVDGEEEKFGKSDYVWVCDSIDGTAMYARHIPVAVFSLALVINGIPEVGVVYDLFTDSLYSAIKGKGAYKNEKKIKVNDFELDSIGNVCHYDMFPSSEYNLYDVIKELGKNSYFISIGSIIRASMCVASGDFTLALFPGTKGKNCDIAAVKVIVEEAGGKVTNLFGEDQRYDSDIKGAIISNGKIHHKVTETVSELIHLQ